MRSDFKEPVPTIDAERFLVFAGVDGTEKE
jgi:hypothetical protein